MRVLLIDDDALVRLLLMDTLAAEGIEVDGLANAEDALVLLGAGQVPDVLVADIDLGPGLSGLDLASIAQERHPAVQVVLISGTSPAPGLLGRRRGQRRRLAHQRERTSGTPSFSFIPATYMARGGIRPA